MVHYLRYWEGRELATIYNHPAAVGNFSSSSPTMAFSFTAVDVLMVSTFFYLLSAFQDYRRRRGLPYPPGPRQWPLIGNLLNAPRQSPWIAYTELSEKHGDVLYFRVFGQAIVVLNSLAAIKDLLEKHGETYLGRPAWPVQEIMGVNWLLSNARERERWLEGRKIADRGFRSGSISLNRQSIEEPTRWFLGQLLAKPADFRGHIELFQAKVIMSFVYGYDLKENDDIIEGPVQLSQVIGRFFYPEAALVNFLPSLRHIPSYEPLARLGRELGRRTMNEPIDFVKKAMVCGHTIAWPVNNFLEVEGLNGPERQTQEDVVKRTASSLASLFVVLTLHPEVQRRAQAQIDSIVSRDRLPTLGDRSRLPYIEAFCRELLRWQVVSPQGVPHASTEDSVYRGFFIPKGSLVVTNIWSILHNPDLFPDPEKFRPERFLNEDGTFRDDPTITLAFGAGKRICPGRHLVDATLFLVAASVLSDVNGNEIPVTTAMQNDVIASHPEKFECAINPRDKEAEDLIQDELALPESVTSTIAEGDVQDR
ncbi:cytochrome P450 [Lactarius indigo]|nr:cytochrome P450 [Lactarius indigo]